MHGRGGGSILAEMAKPGALAPPWGGGGRKLTLGISEPEFKQEMVQGREVVGERHQERPGVSCRREAVGSGRLDSCHTEMASGLTASCVRCLRVAAAVLWKSMARSQHQL